MAKDQGIKRVTWKCKLFGHTPTGQITGFRNEDAAVITRCARCNMPIVSPFWRASQYIMDDLYNQKNRQEMMLKYERECG